MRIKIIGDNNCARATRHLLRKAGFAVSEYIPADAITRAPHFGYVITIELAPAPHPDASSQTLGVNPATKPEYSTHGPTAGNEEASAFAKASADLSAFADATADSSAFADASAGASSPSFSVTCGKAGLSAF